MTARGWWCLFVVGATLLVGVWRDVSALVVTGLALLMWIGWVWLFFQLRARTLLRRLRLRREVCDSRGPLTTLWAGREYTVHVELSLDARGWLPFLRLADVVPFGTQHEEGPTTVDGEVRAGQVLTLEYRVFCPLPGVARFEGARIEVSDLQGFFAVVLFLRDPLVLPVLPGVLVQRGGGPTVKRRNELPPPGIHHLRRPGSGSELLDLRDYLPGDPPRTIAWKVSARRDRLVTKEFESEVPVRCTLFIDVSSSVRVPSPAGAEDADELAGPAYFKPLDRLVDLAGGVLQGATTVRDLTGLCLFDEVGFQAVRPARTSNHRLRLMRLLGEAAARGPVAAHADPEVLLPVAYALAREVYPDLLRPEVNAMPAWMVWLVGFPGYTRHRRGLVDLLHRRKQVILIAGTSLIPLTLLAINLVALTMSGVPDWARGLLGGLLFFGAPLAALLAWLVFLVGLAASGKQRRLARWRKGLAALLTVRSQGASEPSARLPLPGGLDALLEDDDLFSAHLQQFLAEHQVPVAVPLYDPDGRYLFALPRKVQVLAEALLGAVNVGRDNELFVLLADLLELDSQLDPLLRAVRVALGRHHQVLVVCPWPQGVPLPEETTAAPAPAAVSPPGLVLELEHQRLRSAYERIRHVFARMGVQVVCAASDATVPLILTRLEQIRSARIAQGLRRY